MMRLMLLGVGVSLLWFGSVQAGEILLKNGAVIRGRIISESNDAVVIDIRPTSTSPDAHVRMTIPKKRIRKIIRDGANPPALIRETKPDDKKTPKLSSRATKPITSGKVDQQPKPRSDATTGKPPDTSSADDKAAEEDTYAGPILREEEIDPALLMRVKAFVDALKTEDEKLRTKTETRLLSIGKDAAPTLARAVLGTHRQQRSAAARVLGNLGAGGKEGVLALIDQFTEAQQEKHFMRVCFYALKKITKQPIFFQQDKTLRKRKYDQRKWLTWFTTVETKYPVQTGFEIAPEQWEKKAEEVAKRYKKENAKPRPVQWVMKRGYKQKGD